MGEKKKVKVVLSIILDIIIVFALILCAFFVFFRFTYDTAIVSGQSMYPTLNASASDDVVGIRKNAKIKKGDIVISKPEYLTKILIKRVIALGGDYVDMRFNENNELEILLNGEVLVEDYIKNPYKASDNPLAFTNFEKLRQEKPERFDELGYHVEDGEVFLMGDNRKVSKDCTFYGAFDISSIRGKVEYVYTKKENDFFAFISYEIFKMPDKLKRQK